MTKFIPVILRAILTLQAVAKIKLYIVKKFELGAALGVIENIV